MSEYSNNSSKTTGIIVIIVVVLAGLTAAWYFGMYKPEQEAKEQARLEQIAQAEAEKKRQEEAAKRKARYDQLITDADDAFDSEDWQTAQSLYTNASTFLPNEQYPKDQLALVNAKLEEIAAREARIAAGVVETVSSPTERFYVIVSSSIDDDLAMDYAKKLAQEGTSVKLVQHNYNELPFHGISVGDYETWAQAEAALSSFSNFGNVWVLKY
ncbi:hypothetical protein SAMN05421640_1070 [Ekhidna lutea]|uniref:SPOR domain-containing protein n=1 Tax=Ekhidna lutea TaxID=447679 RepID=A0A239GZG1_EKHLU|nr:hypothetical protein [Ekhidna lutea]SNS74301.1 hypothetical protein SAMN05421640_1070 [Ekhidna lutea]